MLESRDSGISSCFLRDSVIRHVIVISYGQSRYNTCFPWKLISPTTKQPRNHPLMLFSKHCRTWSKIAHLILNILNRFLRSMNKIAHFCMTHIPSYHNIKASCFQYKINYKSVKTTNFFIVNKLSCLARARLSATWSLLTRQRLNPSFCFVIRSYLLIWIINKLNSLCCRLKICALTVLWLITLHPLYLSRLILLCCLNRWYLRVVAVGLGPFLSLLSFVFFDSLRNDVWKDWKDYVDD